MRRQYYRYIAIVILLIAGIIYYNRPLHLDGPTDPGEEYFALPERTLPSSWDMVNQDYGYDKKSEEIDKLGKIDEALQGPRGFPNDPEKIDYIAITGGVITNINRDNISRLFTSGDNAEIIQYHINNLAKYMSGYEYYPTRLNYSDAIPRASGLQGIYRVASMYSSSLCHHGNIQGCTDNLRTLMQFSQQVKNGGSLVNLLIGVVLENITLQHIEYLAQSNPQAYQAIITMLRHDIHYLDAKTVIHNAFVTEYQIFKNTIDTLPTQIFSYAMYDMVNTMVGGEGTRLEDIIVIVAKFIKIPPKLLFDPSETKSIGRSYYHYIMGNISNEEIMIQNNIKHARSRKNIIGYHLLNALIPRLTGITQRTIDQEIKFQELIKD